MASGAALKVQETYEAFLAQGHERRPGPQGFVVRCNASPRIYDANFLAGVKARTPDEIRALLDFQEQAMDELPHRHVLTGPGTPAEFTAELVLRSYKASPTLQLVLEGELDGPPPDPRDIRPVETEADWRSFERLLRMDHEEENRKPGSPGLSEEVTRQMAAALRAKAPDFQLHLLRIDKIDVAFFGATPGQGGMGMVEDLFTLPAHRKRGLARALIHHCVADARARGAERVLIGADPLDTPKQAYAALGFRPTCLTWSYLLAG